MDLKASEALEYLLARHVRLSSATLRRYSEDNTIYSTQSSGGHRRYHPEDLDAFVEGRKPGRILVLDRPGFEYQNTVVQLGMQTTIVSLTEPLNFALLLKIVETLQSLRTTWLLAPVELGTKSLFPAIAEVCRDRHIRVVLL